MLWSWFCIWQRKNEQQNANHSTQRHESIQCEAPERIRSNENAQICKRKNNLLLITSMNRVDNIISFNDREWQRLKISSLLFALLGIAATEAVSHGLLLLKSSEPRHVFVHLFSLLFFSNICKTELSALKLKPRQRSTVSMSPRNSKLVHRCFFFSSLFRKSHASRVNKILTPATNYVKLNGKKYIHTITIEWSWWSHTTMPILWN